MQYNDPYFVLKAAAFDSLSMNSSASAIFAVYYWWYCETILYCVWKNKQNDLKFNCEILILVLNFHNRLNYQFIIVSKFTDF